MTHKLCTVLCCNLVKSWTTLHTSYTSLWIFLATKTSLKTWNSHRTHTTTDISISPTFHHSISLKMLTLNYVCVHTPSPTIHFFFCCRVKLCSDILQDRALQATATPLSTGLCLSILPQQQGQEKITKKLQISVTDFVLWLSHASVVDKHVLEMSYAVLPLLTHALFVVHLSHQLVDHCQSCNSCISPSH